MDDGYIGSIKMNLNKNVYDHHIFVEGPALMAQYYVLAELLVDRNTYACCIRRIATEAERAEMTETALEVLVKPGVET